MGADSQETPVYLIQLMVKDEHFLAPSMSISNQVKDYYWDKQDCPIPYTEAAMKFKVKTYKGSADEMK